MEEKDDLILKEGSGFAAITAFFKEKATMVQMHMPDQLMETAPKDPPPKKHELKKIKELEDKVAKYEAKVEEKPEGNKTYIKEASEKKDGFADFDLGH